MRAVADEQVLVDRNSQLTQPIDLTDQRDWIDNHTIPNHASFAASQNSRGDQVQYILHAAMDNGVPGVIATLTADNDVRVRSQYVDNFALALIAPLHSDQNCVGHRN